MVSFGSSKEKSQSQSFTKEQKEWLAKALGVYGPQLGQNNNVWQGDRIAGLTPTQENIFGGLKTYSNAFSPNAYMPGFSAGLNALTRTVRGQTGANKISGTQTNRYFANSIQRPRMKTFNDVEMPAIKEAFGGPGYWGSARADAQRESARDVSDWLGQQRSDLNWNVLQQNQAIDEAKAGRMLSGSAMMPTYSQMPTQNALANLGGEAQTLNLANNQQSQNQAQIQSEIDKFAEENQITDPQNLQILMSLLGMSYNTGKSSGSSWKGGLEW